MAGRDDTAGFPREPSERSRELQYREHNERHNGKPSLFPARIVHEALLVLRYRIALRSMTYPQAGIFIGSQSKRPTVCGRAGVGAGLGAVVVKVHSGGPEFSL